MNRDEIQSRIDSLIRTAETGEQWAEIARLEALLNDGPWHENQTTPKTEDLQKVTIRNYRGGKAHPGFRRPDGSWWPCCSCPGTANGSLRNKTRIIAEGWEAANCKN